MPTDANNVAGEQDNSLGDGDEGIDYAALAQAVVADDSLVSKLAENPAFLESEGMKKLVQKHTDKQYQNVNTALKKQGDQIGEQGSQLQRVSELIEQSGGQLSWQEAVTTVQKQDVEAQEKSEQKEILTLLRKLPEVLAGKQIEQEPTLPAITKAILDSAGIDESQKSEFLKAGSLEPSDALAFIATHPSETSVKGGNAKPEKNKDNRRTDAEFNLDPSKDWDKAKEDGYVITSKE